MRKFNWIAIITVVVSLLIAAGLHWASRDYEFTPRVEKELALKEDQPQPDISKRLVSLVRTTGSIEPGNVEIQAIFLNPVQQLPENRLVFQIAFNTHSVNLTDYDITKKAVIEDSEGRVITEGFKWKQTHNQGYHHIMGLLTVPDLRDKGSLTGKDVKWIKLVVKGVPKIAKREFRWDLARISS